MARTERSTKAQAQAYRFGLRRLEDAVQYGSSLRRSLQGPRHGSSVAIGAVLAAVLLAGYAVYGFIRPAPSINGAKVLVDRDSGGAFVVRGDVVHPALNLASALLAQDGTGDGQVRRVTTATLNTLPKGPLIGIPGAPQQIPAPDHLAKSTWTVCDKTEPNAGAAPGKARDVTTTVIVGSGAPGSVTSDSMLVTTTGQDHWLLHDGKRSRVDVEEGVLTISLGVTFKNARIVSTGLLNAVPETTVMASVNIPRYGETIKTAGGTYTSGQIARVDSAGGPKYFLLVPDGFKAISPIVADTIRAEHGDTSAFSDLPPGMSATNSTFDLAGYPSSKPIDVDVDVAKVLCIDRRVSGSGVVTTLFTATDVPSPANTKAVEVPKGTARSAIEIADKVYVPPGTGLALRQSSDGVSTSNGTLFLVTDEGVAYPVVDENALKSLGLASSDLQPVAPELLSLLPVGPTLDPVKARLYFTEQKGTAGA